MATAKDEAPPAALAPDDPGSPAACRACGCADREDGPVEAVPDWRNDAEANPCRVDVRPMLAAGQAPFAAVMQAADGVAVGGVLLIEAPFDPQPLRRVLAGKGFSTYGERAGPGHWQIWCRRGEAGRHRERISRVEGPGGGVTWQSGGAVHIDVRALEAPKPLVAILALIDSGAHDGRIVVHHQREPLYLYPELEDRGWSYSRLPAPAGEVRLELRGPS